MLRRDFLKIADGLSAATTLLGPARAAMAPDDNYDLVIEGGDVIDPSQSPRGKRDLGINARDEAIALQRVSARPAAETGLAWSKTAAMPHSGEHHASSIS